MWHCKYEVVIELLVSCYLKGDLNPDTAAGQCAGVNYQLSSNYCAMNL